MFAVAVATVAMVAVDMIPMTMIFVHMNTGCRDLMLMLYAYHHAGNK